MTDWTAGYVADIGYTFGYYEELNPLRAKLAFLSAGLVCPEFGTACELGFGQGLSTNLHAAATVVQWHGNDFNPSQAAFAQELAAVAGSGAKLYDEAFDEFAARDDLPEFDYIGLHGIWSWISDANRAVIVEFVRRKLKVGGVLYVSYNTLPGWAIFAPMRHLMTTHAELMSASGEGIVNRIDAAIGFADKLLATHPLYGRLSSTIGDRLTAMKGLDRQYLAHEYFNRDWHPMYFSTFAEWIAPAKVQYATSADYIGNIPAVCFSVEQQALLSEIKDPLFKETTRDFILNQQFRRDYWVKGARNLAPLEKLEALRALRIVLVVHPSDVKMKIKTPVGEAGLNEAVYMPIINALSDHKPRTIGQLENELREQKIAFTALQQAIEILVGTGAIAQAQSEDEIATAKTRTLKLNAHLIKKAQSQGDIAHLACPVTGGGVPVDRFQQIFLLAIANKKTQPAEWVNIAWALMNRQGQRLVKDGVPLDSAEENIAELTSRAERFAANRLPVLKALHVI